jgi:hypothetical protein
MVSRYLAQPYRKRRSILQHNIKTNKTKQKQIKSKKKQKQIKTPLHHSHFFI